MTRTGTLVNPRLNAVKQVNLRTKQRFTGVLLSIFTVQPQGTSGEILAVNWKQEKQPVMVNQYFLLTKSIRCQANGW